MSAQRLKVTMSASWRRSSASWWGMRYWANTRRTFGRTAAISSSIEAGPETTGTGDGASFITIWIPGGSMFPAEKGRLYHCGMKRCTGSGEKSGPGEPKDGSKFGEAAASERKMRLSISRTNNRCFGNQPMGRKKAVRQGAEDPADEGRNPEGQGRSGIVPSAGLW